MYFSLASALPRNFEIFRVVGGRVGEGDWLRDLILDFFKLKNPETKNQKASELEIKKMDAERRCSCD